MKLTKTKKKPHLGFRGTSRNLTATLRDFFLYRFRILQYGIVILGALASGLVTAWVLFGDGGDALPEERIVTLNTEVADMLELTIEERQTGYENPPRIPSVIFK